MSPAPLLRLAAAIALLLCSTATAQRTWIVDPSGNGDFTDLPPAVEAASSGDLILIRPSVVRGAVVNKSLRILPDPACNLLGPLIVENLGPSDVVVIGQMFAVAGLEPQLILIVRNCDGRVHVGDVQLAANGDPVQSPSWVEVVDCASVTFQNCQIIDLRVRRSKVLLNRCLVHGDALPRDTRLIAFPGIDCADSDLTLVSCGVRGGVSFRDPPIIPGIKMLRGALRLTGEPGRTGVMSGATFNRSTGRSTPGPAIHSDDGIVEFDPRVNLTTQGGVGPLLTGTSRFSTVPRDFVVGSTRNPAQGGTFEAHVFGSPGSTAWTFLSTGAHPTPWLLGDLWLDLNRLILIGSGTIPPTGPLTYRIPIGANLCPSGTVFAAQALLLDGQGGVSLALPAVQILKPSEQT